MPRVRKDVCRMRLVKRQRIAGMRRGSHVAGGVRRLGESRVVQRVCVDFRVHCNLQERAKTGEDEVDDKLPGVR